MSNRSVVLVALAVMGCADRSKSGDAANAADAIFTPVEVASAATSNGATPMFLVTASGAKVLSWVAAPDTGQASTLHVQVIGPDGSVQRSEIVDPLGGVEPHGEAPPQIATGPGGALYALYTVGKDIGERYPASALRLARSDDGGSTWSAPFSVNEGDAFGSHSFHALIAGDDGMVYAAWINNKPGETGVWLRASADEGRTWGPSRAVYAAPTCPCCRTALAIGTDGTLYLAWRAILAGDVRDIVVMSSKDRGATWSTPIRPQADEWVFPGCPHAGPSLKIDGNGDLHISWWTGKSGSKGVWYARSTDGGVSWLSTPIDTSFAAQPSHVQVAITGQHVIVGWDGGPSGPPGVFVIASRDGGVTFGKAVRLSDAAVAATFPVLGAGPDSLTVAWTQVADAAYRKLLEAHREPTGEHERMALPRVGEQEVMTRRVAVGVLASQP